MSSSIAEVKKLRKSVDLVVKTVMSEGKPVSLTRLIEELHSLPSEQIYAGIRKATQAGQIRFNANMELEAVEAPVGE